MIIMFSIDDRNRLQDSVLEMASSDPRVVAGAVLGSLARGEGDRWSDLDLMFAVADDVPVMDVLEAWSQNLIRQFDATSLFDLASGPITYRVFVLPNSMELDLSFTPASRFGAGGPKFRLLFGEAVDQSFGSTTPAPELFGYAVHHALHARACIERGRYWQAEYWISAVRDHALALACDRRGLEGDHGRDFDTLPTEVLRPLDDALVRSLNPGELRRALGRAVTALLRESDEAKDMAEKVESQLRELVSEPNT
jgi:predicted nucleotidyltransferase